MDRSNFEKMPNDPERLEAFINRKEKKHNLKQGTKATIVWQNKDRNITEYSLVYLHGFRASHPEGEPVHRKVAEKMGANLYLSRLQEHGLVAEKPLRDLTKEKLLDSAHFAFEVGKRIGKKVILMGTSTGGSLGLYLASQPRLQQSISALVLYSPLIDFYSYPEKCLKIAAFRKLLTFTLGRNYLVSTAQSTRAEERIWYKYYALQGALVLGEFVQHYMTKKKFADVQCPVFTGYYFKNKLKQDKIVSVSAIKRMVKQIGTRTEMNQSVNFPEAKSHVISSSLTSPITNEVIYNSYNFLKKSCMSAS